MKNLYNPVRTPFSEVTPTVYSVAAGAAGFVDTDVSGSVPAIARGVLLMATVAVTSSAGARDPGSAVDSRRDISAFTQVIFFTGQIGQHIEFYRNALTQVDYVVMGYF